MVELELSAQNCARLQARLEMLLREHGTTRTDLADALHVSRNTIGRIGQAGRGPALATLLAIRRQLKLPSLAVLVDGLTAATAPQPEVYVTGPYGFTAAGRRYMTGIVLPELRSHGFAAQESWGLQPAIGGDGRAVVSAHTQDPGGQREAHEHLIRRASAVFALLEGADVDSGTSADIGFAAALRVPTVAFQTDARLVAGDTESVVDAAVRRFVQTTGGRVVTTLTEAMAALHDVLA